MKQFLDPWFVTGFSEGSGSFTYSRSGGVFALYFALKVGANDLPLLQSIQAFFGGLGRIYHSSSSSNLRERNGAAVYFRINRIAQLERVVAHFDRYPPQGAQGRRFELWRSMVNLKRRFRKPATRELGELAIALSATTARKH